MAVAWGALSRCAYTSWTARIDTARAALATAARSRVARARPYGIRPGNEQGVSDAAPASQGADDFLLTDSHGEAISSLCRWPMLACRVDGGVTWPRQERPRVERREAQCRSASSCLSELYLASPRLHIAPRDARRPPIDILAVALVDAGPALASRRDALGSAGDPTCLRARRSSPDRRVTLLFAQSGYRMLGRRHGTRVRPRDSLDCCIVHFYRHVDDRHAVALMFRDVSCNTQRVCVYAALVARYSSARFHLNAGSFSQIRIRCACGVAPPPSGRRRGEVARGLALGRPKPRARTWTTSRPRCSSCAAPTTACLPLAGAALGEAQPRVVRGSPPLRGRSFPCADPCSSMRTSMRLLGRSRSCACRSDIASATIRESRAGWELGDEADSGRPRPDLVGRTQALPQE